MDGLNVGGNSLTVSNTTVSATAGTGTIQFIADATNNTVTRCTIQGSSTTPLATVGGTIIFSTGTTTGNDGNTVSLCNIGPAGANLPSKAIFALGSTSSAGIRNSGVTIDNNNIFDFFLPTNSTSGVHILNGNDNWTISNNRIYQTASRTFTTTAGFALCRYHFEYHHPAGSFYRYRKHHRVRGGQRNGNDHDHWNWKRPAK